MFCTVFVDDSGTAPEHKNAVASALVIPSARITSLEREWNLLLKNEGFPSGLHSSELAACNLKSGFANWDYKKQSKVLRRARQITKKFGIVAFSMAVKKTDYDEVVHKQLKQLAGQYHYTWGVRWVIAWLEAWADANSITLPFEYVFDCMGDDKKNLRKREIESVMTQAEQISPGKYEGHYSFKNRKEVPGLQCADLLAWSCYRFSLEVMFDQKANKLAATSFNDFQRHKNQGWLQAVAIKRENLKAWADEELSDPESQQRRKNWNESGKIR